MKIGEGLVAKILSRQKKFVLYSSKYFIIQGVFVVLRLCYPCTHLNISLKITHSL